MPTVHVDLVTQSKDGKTFNLILVEEGPWLDDQIAERLHALQDRLNDVVDAVLSGAVAARYSRSHGAPLVIRVDYGLPEGPVAEFLERFGEHLAEPELARLISESEQAASIRLEWSLESLPPTEEEPQRPWWKRVLGSRPTKA